MKLVGAVKSFAVCLTHCQLVFSTLKDFYFIWIFKAASPEIDFSGNENGALDSNICNCFIIVCVLEDNVGNPDSFKFFIRKSIKRIILFKIVVVDPVFISFHCQSRF